MLRFVVALESEARPLVDHFRLRREPEAHPFAVYQRDTTALVVSGIGKVVSAAATAYLHLATGGERHAVWLNVGIAGHRDHPVGQSLIAHKIRDAGNGRCWYPPRLKEAGPSTEVVTVDVPENDYPESVAYEMEASGFYDTACRFSSSELVQCLKIVSDGPKEPTNRLTVKRITRLVDSCLEQVVALATECSELSAELRRLEADPPDFARCLERWYFTVSDKRRLAGLLRRRQALAPELPLPVDDLGSRVRGREVNGRLQTWLDALALGSETAIRSGTAIGSGTA